MEPADNELINKVCETFRSQWKEGKRPRISDHISGAADTDRDALMSALVEADVDARKAIGEEPNPHDYFQLGSDAVSVASRHINEPGFSFDQGDDVPTALASVDVGENVFVDWANTYSDSKSGISSGQDAAALKFIGRYRLLQEIGVGGMGSVWMAEQKEPVKRRVALKVIRADLGSKSAIARFEAERQAIALMDHQNIAKILDAGTTETGNPYFVMELVNGIPLNKYCDKKKLTVRERLELMIPVCRAVQHAHQKGIIHRDLKHSNVLVTEYDGKPVPKVIDFGLAKALGHQDVLTDKTMFTELGKVVGTLQYMSPEQAETNNLDVDTRTDIYSLGVMIYKLLTGATPLEQDEMVRVSLIEALQMIREKDPSRPSVRLRDDDEDSISVLCSLRQVQKPEKLRQILEGDLDWIVMKTLEKDRRDRYETANALAMELERFLNDEQVLARPHSAIYSIKKFVKRNRGLVASLIGFAVLLLVGIIATTSASFWALYERDRADERSVFAEGETKKAQAAERGAKAAEKEAREHQKMREIELYAMKLKSAWFDWKQFKTESAWRMLNEVAEFGDGWENRFLHSEFTSSEHVLYGHARVVKSVAVSRDGKYIATTAEDDTVKLWDAKTNELIYTKYLNEVGECVRFSRDSSQLACADRSNMITVWMVDSGEVASSIGPFDRDILSLEFLPDGTHLLAGEAASDGYRVYSDREQRDFADPDINFVSIKQAKVIQKLNGHTGDITSLSVNEAGNTFVSGSLDKTVRVWTKTESGFQQQQTLARHFLGVTGVAISPSQELVASSSLDQTIQLWNLKTGAVTRTIAGHIDEVNSVSFSNEGDRIISSSKDRTARVWSIEGEELLVCQGHFSAVNEATFSESGDEILTVSDDTTARIWSSKTNPSIVTARQHSDTVWSADITSDGKIVASGSEDKSLCFTDVATGDLIGKKIELEAAILSVDFSPNGSLLAIGCADEILRIWSMEENRMIQQIKAHENYIWGVSFSNDGKLLATASADTDAKIWDTADWSELWKLDAHAGEVASARFSRDGKYLVTASDDYTVMLWDARNSYEHLHTFEDHKNTVWKAVFSPDGKQIASSGYDGRIIIWSVEKREVIHVLDHHTNQVAGLAYSVDGSRLVSASDDQSIKIWDANSGVELFVLSDKDDTAIVHVSFSDDGTKLLSGNEAWLTVRTILKADSSSETFLPQNSEVLAINGLPVVASPNSTVEELRRELEIAEKCSSHFPTFKTFINLGLAQYRLGHFDEAIKSLIEARRLEPISYGQADLRPHIEAFLAMALFKSGHTKKANEIRAIFNTKKKQPLWVRDYMILNLSEEVDQVFESAD